MEGLFHFYSVTFVEVKHFYRTQRDLATALNQLVGAYWEEEIKEKEPKEGVHFGCQRIM